MFLLSYSEQQTQAFAEKFASRLKEGDVVVLNGDLGAGKTAFTKGLAKGLQIDSQITSPTFNIMKQYDGGRLTLYHFDMYRIEDASDLTELGFEDIIEVSGVCVIEWNKIKLRKPIIVNIERIDDHTRAIEVED